MREGEGLCIIWLREEGVFHWVVLCLFVIEEKGGGVEDFFWLLVAFMYGIDG